VAIVSVWTSSLLEVVVRHAICGVSFFLSFFLSFSSPLCYPLRFQNSPLTCQWECFLVLGNFSSFKTTVPGQISVPTSFVSLFLFYILSHRLSKTMGCLSGSLMSSASIRNCFLEFAQHSMFFRWICGEKVVFLFYFSATLGPPLRRELWILPPQQALFPFCFRPRLQMELDWMLMCLFVFKSFLLQSSLLPFQYCPIDISFSE